MSSAYPWEVLVAPLDIEDPIRCCTLRRGEDPKATEYRVLVVPVWEDGVRRISGRRQALVDEIRGVSDEGRNAVGRQNDRAKRLVIQTVCERQRDGRRAIVA